jgi:hypothetical protein
MGHARATSKADITDANSSNVKRPPSEAACNERSESGRSVRFAATLNYPIDAKANCKEGKSSASDRSWRPMIRSLADIGVGLVGREE